MATRSNRRPALQYRTAEVRALADDEGAGFAGHAAHFWSVDSYGTAVKPGAFRKTLKERGERVPVLWQHDPFSPIGRPTELKEDKEGLAFSAEVVVDTRAGAEAMALLRADVPLGMSFGFETVKSRPVEDADADKLDWSQAPVFYKGEEGRQYVRVIEEVRLWEISLVTFPANDLAAVEDVRADAETLSLLLDAIRGKSLRPEQRALVEQIVAAWGDGAEPAGETPPLTPVEARRETPDPPIPAGPDFALLAAAAATRTRLVLSGVYA